MKVSTTKSRGQDSTRHALTAGICATLVLIAIGLLAAPARGQNSEPTASVHGTVFVTDSGGKSYVPGAKVVLNGPTSFYRAEADAEGKFTFVNLEPGTYTIKATQVGLRAEQTITIEGKAALELDLELKVPEVKTSIDVTSSAPHAETASDTTPSAGGTITEKMVNNAPNADEQFQSLLPMVPGVVRGPDGRINMKGTRITQSGAVINSANVTDPATGAPAINLPIDVVSSVQVISNPYDPQYGKLTGSLSSVETKTGNYEKRHFTFQNILPRPKVRDGSLMGIGSFTPRMTFTGPIWKDRIAITQSLEYRFVETPVNSLPPLQRDTKLEGFNAYTQADINISSKQTATISLNFYPQKLDYMGLNTFTPQPSTVDFRQHGYQLYGQHRLLTGPDSALVSQISYKTYDVNTNAQNNEPYELLINTTEGGYFNRQQRNANRFDWQESYQFAPRQFLGTHKLKVGLDYAHSDFNGTEVFVPAELIGTSGTPIEKVTFSRPSSSNASQNETALYIADQWSPISRLTFTLGTRLDDDSVTSSTHLAPRSGFVLLLTNDGKTLLKGGAGVFYGRVPLMLPVFGDTPERTVSMIGPNGQVESSTAYVNRIVGGLQDPRSTSWNLGVERQVTANFTLGVAYEQRNTARDFIVSPTTNGTTGFIDLSNGGSNSYHEFQVTGRYKLPRFTINGSYTRSRAYGDLNDPFLFFGNYSQLVIQSDARGRLPFDAPNRVLFWGDVAGPWKLTIMPVVDVHTGFPYSPWDQYHDYVGPRNIERFPTFFSSDLQATRPLSIPLGDRRLKARAGVAIFNLFNHYNPRDVQNNINSSSFGSFSNDSWREYRGKLVFEF